MRIIIMLNIQHLTKVYGEKKAVDDLSLHIAPGEIYGFIGHNGAGKTTTLRSVVGILQIRRRGDHHRRQVHPHRPHRLQAGAGLYPR